MSSCDGVGRVKRYGESREEEEEEGLECTRGGSVVLGPVTYSVCVGR